MKTNKGCLEWCKNNSILYILTRRWGFRPNGHITSENQELSGQSTSGHEGVSGYWMVLHHALQVYVHERCMMRNLDYLLVAFMATSWKFSTLWTIISNRYQYPSFPQQLKFAVRTDFLKYKIHISEEVYLPTKFR